MTNSKTSSGATVVDAGAQNYQIMKDVEKIKIRKYLLDYIDRYGSQAKAAKSLKGVSLATINMLINERWPTLSDKMLRNIGVQVGWSASGRGDWEIVDTGAYKKMQFFLEDAKRYANVFGIVGDAGCGKSAAVKHFRDTHENVFVLSCNEFWNRKQFMTELMMAMGRDVAGLTVGELMSEAIRHLNMKDNPLLVIDEADKLSDTVLVFFITLYNSLQDHCGIVLCATDHLEKKIKRGLRLNKKGYKEIYSRLGREFIQLPKANSYDVSLVCMANGVDDAKEISQVLSVAEKYEFDLRRVARKAHAIKLQQQNAKQAV